MRIAALGLSFLSASAWAQMEIERPWVRATVPGMTISAGYALIHNKSSSADRMLSAASPIAGRVETHIHIKDGDIVRMREVKGYDVPANGTLELKPGGAHLMLVDVKKPLKEGDKVPMTLKFQGAGEVRVEFTVGRLAAPPPR